MFWADSVGSAYIHSRLTKWAEIYGSFFKPSQYLEERAKKGIPLVHSLLPFMFIRVSFIVCFIIIDKYQCSD